MALNVGGATAQPVLKPIADENDLPHQAKHFLENHLGFLDAVGHPHPTVPARMATALPMPAKPIATGAPPSSALSNAGYWLLREGELGIIPAAGWLFGISSLGSYTTPHYPDLDAMNPDATFATGWKAAGMNVIAAIVGSITAPFALLFSLGYMFFDWKAGLLNLAASILAPFGAIKDLLVDTTYHIATGK